MYRYLFVIILCTTYLDISTVRDFGEMFFVFQGLVFPVVRHAEQPYSSFVCVRSFSEHHESEIKFKKKNGGGLVTNEVIITPSTPEQNDLNYLAINGTCMASRYSSVAIFEASATFRQSISQNRADTVVVNDTQSLINVRGVEPVTSSHCALDVPPAIAIRIRT